MSQVISELMARRGLLRQQSATVCHEAWRDAAGPEIAECTWPGLVRRGVLEVRAANSTILQELTFQKAEILEKLSLVLPELQIRDLRFRIGTIG